MRVFSALVTSTIFVSLAAALPRPEGADLLKRTDNYDSGSYGSSSSSSGSYGSSSSSSSSSSGYGSSSSSSGYGSSSSSGYDSSKDDNSKGYDSSKNDNSKGYDSSSSKGYESSSYKGYESSSTKAYESTSTQGYQSTSTQAYTSTAAATSTASYGSGSSNWGSSGYNDCVQKCIASYGPPPASYTPPSSTSGGDSSGSKGTGATHTVIVAPTQGVLRYVPFAVNASVGDTVMFMWGAKNHTVTKSSELELCNKTSSAPFASGEHDAPFTFTQVVNDTNPVFYYCGTPGHCQKGMFGMINPPSVYNAPSSVSQMMGGAVSNSSDMAAMMAYTNKMTNGSDKAANWGANIDMAKVPDWAHQSLLENVMYTRAFLGANRETIKDDGSIDLNSHGAPMQLPTDMANVNNAVDSQPSAAANAASAASTPAAAASSAAATPAAGVKTNGAASTVASSALLGVAAIAAAVLAL